MKKQTLPIIANIRKEQGSHIENVAVPFSDGKKGIQALANLDKTISSNGAGTGQCIGAQPYSCSN